MDEKAVRKKLPELIFFIDESGRSNVVSNVLRIWKVLFYQSNGTKIGKKILMTIKVRIFLPLEI